jgi:hypothetical protein
LNLLGSVFAFLCGAINLYCEKNPSFGNAAAMLFSAQETGRAL